MIKHPFCCHTAITLLSHCCHTILSPPPLHPTEPNMLSHYYHITVTPLSPKPFLLPKSTSSPKESAHPSKISDISSKKSHISPKNSLVFSKMSDIFSKMSLISSKKWDIIEESAHLGCAALWQMWQKKTQNSWYIRAREEYSFTPKDKTSRPFDSFWKLVMAISATPKEKSAVFHQSSPHWGHFKVYSYRAERK